MENKYIVSEVRLSYETKMKKQKRIKITGSKIAYQMILGNWDKGQLEHRETFKIVMLNQANEVLGIYQVAEGGLTSVNIDIRLIIQAAILANATGIILVHNHPSGSVMPSREDRNLTAKVSQAVKLMDILLIDHLIISREEYYSFTDEGILP